MVVVLAAKDVDVQGDPSGLGERLKDVRDHLGAEVTDLFSLELEVAAEVRSGGDVEDSAGEGLGCYVRREEGDGRTLSDGEGGGRKGVSVW